MATDRHTDLGARQSAICGAIAATVGVVERAEDTMRPHSYEANQGINCTRGQDGEITKSCQVRIYQVHGRY